LCQSDSKIFSLSFFREPKEKRLLISKKSFSR
jgi:hypothetical protein